MQTENAVIRSVSLGDDEHGGLSGWLQLDFDGAGQGFGGYRLYWPYGFKTGQPQLNTCGHFVWRCMQIAGVEAWEKIPGKTIRVKRDGVGFGSKIIAIGHIVKDEWFNIQEEFETLRRINTEGLPAARATK